MTHHARHINHFAQTYFYRLGDVKHTAQPGYLALERNIDTHGAPDGISLFPGHEQFYRIKKQSGKVCGSDVWKITFYIIIIANGLVAKLVYPFRHIENR